ncbi:hypothetical protein M501DRAFT_1003047 [Patellaria atrata CBS 101060]|uniref:Uncharacterized protein n=1 Tax=Patellaria atrata CBS 101060 TaxID=1346257 RepID=A0A9P4SBL8_9PEZI|nr:hypothetical protein M501DRAFT_1003047 [Patellaria atrata CBS 101060]
MAAELLICDVQDSISSAIDIGDDLAFKLEAISRTKRAPDFDPFVGEIYRLMGILAHVNSNISKSSDFEEDQILSPNGLEYVNSRLESCMFQLQSLDTALDQNAYGLFNRNPFKDLWEHCRINCGRIVQLSNEIQQFGIAIQLGRARRRSSPRSSKDIYMEGIFNEAITSPATHRAPNLGVFDAIAPQPPQHVEFPNLPRSYVQLQHPQGFRGRYGEPDYPSMQKKERLWLDPGEPDLKFPLSFEEEEVRRYQEMEQGKYPSVIMFGNWPPTFIQENSIQELHIRALRNVNPLAPKPDSGKADSEPKSITAETTVHDEKDYSVSEFEFIFSHEVDNGEEPTTIHDEVTRDGQDTSDKSVNVLIEENARGKTGLNEVPSDLEGGILKAWTLNPTVAVYPKMIEWSTEITLLPLNRETIQQRVLENRTKGTIIDELRGLTSRESATVFDFVSSIKETILSIERSRSVILPTTMGAHEVQTLVFFTKGNDVFTEKKPYLFNVEPPTFDPFKFSTKGDAEGLFDPLKTVSESPNIFSHPEKYDYKTTNATSFGHRKGKLGPQSPVNLPIHSGIGPFRQHSHNTSSNPEPPVDEGVAGSGLKSSITTSTADWVRDRLDTTLFSNFPNQPEGETSSNTTARKPTSLFDTFQAQSTGLFGLPTEPSKTSGHLAPGLFGSTSGTQRQSGTSLFDKPTDRPTTQFGGLFGKPKPRSGEVICNIKNMPSGFFGGTSIAGSSLFDPKTTKASSNSDLKRQADDILNQWLNPYLGGASKEEKIGSSTDEEASECELKEEDGGCGVSEVSGDTIQPSISDAMRELAIDGKVEEEATNSNTGTEFSNSTR